MVSYPGAQVLDGRPSHSDFLNVLEMSRVTAVVFFVQSSERSAFIRR